METSQKLRLAGIALLAVCAILLFTPVGSTNSRDCGSVLSNGPNWIGCEAARGNRLTISLIVGAVGAVALYGASQVKKSEDD